jgi:hypothetical protein
VTKQRILAAVREICLDLPALICAAPEGLQAARVETDPERFYVPPYFGHRGWIGIHLDRGFDRDEIAGLLEDAFAEVAPARLLPTG